MFGVKNFVSRGNWLVAGVDLRSRCLRDLGTTHDVHACSRSYWHVCVCHKKRVSRLWKVGSLLFSVVIVNSLDIKRNQSLSHALSRLCLLRLASSWSTCIPKTFVSYTLIFNLKCGLVVLGAISQRWRSLVLVGIDANRSREDLLLLLFIICLNRYLKHPAGRNFSEYNRGLEHICLIWPVASDTHKLIFEVRPFLRAYACQHLRIVACQKIKIIARFRRSTFNLDAQQFGIIRFKLDRVRLLWIEVDANLVDLKALLVARFFFSFRFDECIDQIGHVQGIFERLGQILGVPELPLDCIFRHVKRVQLTRLHVLCDFRQLWASWAIFFRWILRKLFIWNFWYLVELLCRFYLFV